MLVLTWVGHMSVQLVDWQYEFSQYANLLSQTTFMATLMHIFYADIKMQISGIILKKVYLFLPKNKWQMPEK